MRKILTIIFALVLFVLAILIQLDLITILTVTATSLNATPTSVYVLWTILLLFENLTYSFFIQILKIFRQQHNILRLKVSEILLSLRRRDHRRRNHNQNLLILVLNDVEPIDHQSNGAFLMILWR